MPSLRLRPASRSGRSPLTATLPALRATLDGLETNVFVCDLEYQLVYVNRCAVRTARSFEPQLRAALGVGLGELLFGSIHRFHEDPARIGRILRDPRNFPYRGSFRFEGVVLLGDVNALTDEDGEVIGYCVAWRDITEQAGVAAAPTEQTSASLREVSGTVSSAVAVAADAVAAAEAATERIGQLSPSSQQLGSVVQLLSGIATQTSLLALNATLEAARAGQAGTGSAVVAGEVEDLAQETAAATRRITERITALREDGAQATASIEGVAALSSSVGEVADVAGTAGTPPGRVTRRD